MSPASESFTGPFVDKGLANVVVANSVMSFIDGEKGVLEYVGIDIDTLARNSTFEECCFLLWNQRLPKAEELASFTEELQAAMTIPDGLMDMVKALPADTSPMHAVRTLVSAQAHFDTECDDGSPEANLRKALRLTARTPSLIANFDRHRKGLELIAPDPSKTVAGNFLTILNGESPTPAMERGFDICLILHAEHGFNASTFASMATISTLSDLYSAATTAVGTLKGPLHGGANEAVMKMLNEIPSEEDVEPFIKARLAAKDRIMGFGHRVYKVYDPRATYLKTYAEDIARDTGNDRLFRMSKKIEETMFEAVGAKGIHPNVDFYSATTYHCLGLDLDLFTPIFAMARMPGWVGHCIEYLQDNKLMRPRCDYVGPHGVPYTDIADR